MKALKFLVLITVLVPLFMPENAQAKFYKWVDENGITHYSEFPPSSGQLEKEYDTYESNEVNRNTVKKDVKSFIPKEKHESKDKNDEEITEDTKLDIAGKWELIGSSRSIEYIGLAKTVSEKNLTQPYKSESWIFHNSEIVTHQIGNKTYKTDYHYDSDYIRVPLNVPYDKKSLDTYRFFEIVKKDRDKMIWAETINVHHHYVRKIYYHIKRVKKILR